MTRASSVRPGTPATSHSTLTLACEVRQTDRPCCPRTARPACRSSRRRARSGRRARAAARAAGRRRSTRRRGCAARRRRGTERVAGGVRVVERLVQAERPRSSNRLSVVPKVPESYLTPELDLLGAVRVQRLAAVHDRQSVRHGRRDVTGDQAFDVVGVERQAVARPEDDAADRRELALVVLRRGGAGVVVERLGLERLLARADRQQEQCRRRTTACRRARSCACRSRT